MKIKHKFTVTERLSYSIQSKHPWIFNSHFKNSHEFKNGDLITLIDSHQKELATGIYSNSGLISLRIFHFGQKFNKLLLVNRVRTAIERRIPILKITNSLRLIHGENDFLPGITIDLHHDTLLVMIYSDSLRVMGRYISALVYSEILKHSSYKVKVKTIIFKPPLRVGTKNKTSPFRVLRGEITDSISIRYRNLIHKIDPLGQKGGMYNDIRNLREYIFLNPLLFDNKNVLNLFSNNGLLSNLLEKIGAKKIFSVESSESALEIHKSNILDARAQEIIRADIFKSLPSVLKQINLKFNVIIIDPPSLTSKEEDKKSARLAYQKLIRQSLDFLVNDGLLILCSCSNRIHANDFQRISQDAIREANFKGKCIAKLKPEIDHPIIDEFPEGNYFKVHIYKMEKL